MSFNIGDTVIRLDDGNGHTVVDVVPTGTYIKLKDVRGWYVADDFRAADRLDALQYAAAADPSAENDRNPDNAREFREILSGRCRVPHGHKSTNYPYPPENETLARAVDITAAAEHPQAMWRVDR